MPLAAPVIRQVGRIELPLDKRRYNRTTLGWVEPAFSDHYASKGFSNRPVSDPFFLPKSLLKKHSNVLIVDDVIRAGNTFEALTSICIQAKANIIGIFAMFITSSAHHELKKRHKVNYLVLAED